MAARQSANSSSLRPLAAANSAAVAPGGSALVSLADPGDALQDVLRQRAVAAQLVEDGAADSRISVGVELDAALGVELVGRLDQAEGAGRLQVFDVHAGRQLGDQLAQDVPHQAQVRLDQLVAPRLLGHAGVGSR